MMTTVEHLLKQIESLDYEAKAQLYTLLKQDLVRQKAKTVLNKYRGIAKHVWGEVQQRDKLWDNN